MKRITIDLEKCVKCGLCSRVCPMQINVAKEASSTETCQLENYDCIKCGTCIRNCPVNALSFEEVTSEKKEKEKLKIQKAKIKKINNFSENVKEFVISAEDKIALKAGQYILIKVGEDELFVWRAYSIARIINEKEFSIAIKIDKKGLATGEIFKLKEGDEITIQGPKGKELVLRDNEKHIFIGIGIGITTFVSLVKEALEKGRKIVLYHGARYKKDLIYKDYFETLAKENKNFDYIYSLTKEKAKRQGRIPRILEKEKFDLTSDAYICGNKKGVESSKKVLVEKGLKNFYVEAF